MTFLLPFRFVNNDKIAQIFFGLFLFFFSITWSKTYDYSKCPFGITLQCNQETHVEGFKDHFLVVSLLNIWIRIGLVWPVRVET